MAFDHDKHTLDPVTGFQIDKETGHRIGLDPAPVASKHLDPDWPKWIEPHPSHIDRAGDHISLPHFPEFHVQRGTNKVTVLVHDEKQEAMALAER